MNTFVLYLVNHIYSFLPETRLFGIKRRLLRLAGAEIGKNVRICSSVRVYGQGNLIIGENSWIGHHTLIICTGTIDIGSNVDIGPRVYIGTGSHEIDVHGVRVAGKGTSKGVVIKNGSWVGVNCTLLPGVTIGEKAVVGAGSVVIDDISSQTIVAGVPAKVIKNL